MSKGFDVVGIDNNMRGIFLLARTDPTTWKTSSAESRPLPRFRHMAIDVRDADALR